MIPGHRMSERTLPPGQHAISFFPRFGLPAFAAYRSPPVELSVSIHGDGVEPGTIGRTELERLPRRELVADFHCVTTWTVRSLHWEGWPLRAVYESLLRPRYTGAEPPPFLGVRGADGFSTTLFLEDALSDDVLLADRLDGAPLGDEHGAPLRLVAPALYGYKNVKHLSELSLQTAYRAGLAERQTRAHPRGRVALEERGRGMPSWAYRLLYRALLRPTLWFYQRSAR